VSALQDGCDKHAVGIDIIAVRVTKPRIPEGIRSNYEAMERERTKLLIAEQSQLVTLKEEETLAKKDVIEAEKQMKVSEITCRKNIAEKEAEAELAAIEDKVYVDTQKALADAEFYTAKKETEANSVMFSDEYMKQQQILAHSKSQFVIGDAIPSTLVLGGAAAAAHSATLLPTDT